MTIGIAAPNLLDERECWSKWIELGSLERVRREYQRTGVLNKRTGDPPTISAIQKAAYRWVLKNLEEAREQIKHEWEKEGRFLTDDEWKKYHYRILRITYYQTPVKLKKLIAQHGLREYAS